MSDAINLPDVRAKHAAWLRGKPDGQRANLAGANLAGANLRGADLRWADLRWADLREADLRWANLREAGLAEADLREANLVGADLAEADLRWANLREADLRWANLRGANLHGANLHGANLHGVGLAGANLREADLVALGHDARGYLFCAYANDDGVVEIRAGCRQFTGIAAARAHWQAAHTDDLVLRADCLSLVQRAETMAVARGWKLETDTQEGQP